VILSIRFFHLNFICISLLYPHICVGVELICEKTTTLIFLDPELVHHFIDRKLVIQSSSFRVRVILQPTVSRPVRHGVRLPLGQMTRF
jgi:hypothetical protein